MCPHSTSPSGQSISVVCSHRLLIYTYVSHVLCSCFSQLKSKLMMDQGQHSGIVGKVAACKAGTIMS